MQKIYEEIDLAEGYDLKPLTYLCASSIEKAIILEDMCSILLPRSSFARIELILPILSYANQDIVVISPSLCLIPQNSIIRISIHSYYIVLCEIKGESIAYKKLSDSKYHNESPLSSPKFNDKEIGLTGLDNYIESKDKENNTNVCKFKVLSGDVIEEREEVEGGERTNAIQIFNKEGIYLFSIERKGIAETRLTVRQLYNKGIQWFESGADNYHKLIDVNPDLQDKEKCKKTDNNGLGVLYFDWKDIVKFAEALYQPSKTIYDLITNFSKYFSRRSGDWKQSPKGARGYVLISMEGIPYWADAVGQIPFAINAYRTFYEAIHNHTSAKNAVVNIGYIFSKGEKNELLDLRKYIQWNTNIDPKLYEKNPNPPSDKDSYDNKMIVRAIRYVYLSKYANNQSLALDSQGNNIYEK